MYARKNLLKKKLMQGKMVLGTETWMRDPRIIDLIGFAGFDFVHIENEHVARDYSNLEATVRAAHAAGVTPLYRTEQCINNQPPVNEIIKALDCGVQCIMIPTVETAEAARKIVQAARFAPLGERGLATCDLTFPKVWPAPGVPLDVNQACDEVNAETLIYCIIETPEGVKNVEEIASVEGIDVLGFGHQDYAIAARLSSDHSLAGDEARERVWEAAKRHNKLTWDYIDSAEELNRVKKMGTRIVDFGVDMNLYLGKLYENMSSFKKFMRNE